MTLRAKPVRLALACLLATAATGTLVAQTRPNRPVSAERLLYKDASQPVAARVEDLLRRMTLEEKVAQMIGVWEKKGAIQDAKGNFSAAKASRVFPDGLGQITRPSDKRGVTASNNAAGVAADAVNRTAQETADYINAAQRWAVERTRLGIPMIMHEEALHGYVARGATSFPQSIALASSWDPALVERVFGVAAREMRARGANLALAPVVDVARDPRWGRIEETYGEDPHLVGEMGLAAIRGFQGTTLPLAPTKVMVTLKHMTGHGQPENGTNVGPANISERTLRENFFPPFERAVKELPVQAVMASYNEIDGIPSHANKWLLDDVLRREWGYKGSVVSDYFAIKELNVRHHLYGTDMAAAGRRALDAGVDMELPDAEGWSTLAAMVKSGQVPQEQVDNAVRRILTMKFQMGLFENPYADARTAEAKTATPDAIALAREAAVRSMVLLKNRNNLLPLDPAKVGKMLVVGTHARDTPIGGYSDVPKHVVSVLEGMQQAAQGRFSVDYAEGVRLTRSRQWAADKVELVPAAENAPLIEEAVRKAAQADTILLVLGQNEQLSREAWADAHLGDRQKLDLIGEQNELARRLFATGKPVVVVLLNGGPLAATYLEANAPAIVEGWYLGQETGNAVADVVLGRANPGGKLPVSVPRSEGQLPIFYNHKPTSRRGYLFDTTAPLYPFGYGLSYTSFDIGAPRLAKATIGRDDTVRVSVDVANTGRRVGDEVIQLYVRDDEATVTRPVLELKHFQRVTLQPGEKRTVTFDLKPSDLAFWNVAMHRVVEPGTFTISAGNSSTALKTATLTVR
ncbi:glycoside hydrolase family 3 N-terminal domain-containing protein [Sphingomonas sp. Leaf62]|uniref:glycoside hydrolase family 3 N-terminal domain-containing protein n=1 Tax=Sphingomonas sp. Leaf62 TaxID=1736228 RepID=UPI000A6F5946|nr:glycoside hydrolase family 3 N-terminal domain-containing protein [Sphingomonas sp. Leaf62]